MVIKTLEDEWYVVIKSYKLTVFEILRDFFVLSYLRVRAIPTLESTDSMIYICVSACVIITSHTLLPYDLTSVDFGNLDGCSVV